MAFNMERIHYLIRTAQEKRTDAIIQAHLDMNKAFETYATELEKLLISGASDADDGKVPITLSTEPTTK